MSYAIAQMVAEQLHLSTLPKGVRVLDVAAGSGVWSIPIAECGSHVQVDALDFPSVLEVTRKFSARHDVAAQFNYLSGDWRAFDFQPDYYDVITIGHLLHSEGHAASVELLCKLLPSLKSGGKVIIGEFMPNDERTAPVVAVLFAINMFLQTTEGCVFSFSELKTMLENAGYTNIERPTLPMFGAESPVVVAHKK